jgi:hypothetical protein
VANRRSAGARRLEGPTDLEDSSIEDESGVGLSLFLVNLQGMMVTDNVPRRIKNHDPKVKFRLAADHPEQRKIFEVYENSILCLIFFVPSEETVTYWEHLMRSIAPPLS